MTENRNRILTGITVILILLLISNWYGHRVIKSSGSGAFLESNLEYLDLIKTHKSAAKFIEQNYPQSMVFTSWPQIFELSNPTLGYVTVPIKCALFSKIEERQDSIINLIYYSNQSHEAFKMRKLMDTLKMKLLKSYECNGKDAAIYQIVGN